MRIHKLISTITASGSSRSDLKEFYEISPITNIAKTRIRVLAMQVWFLKSL